MTRAEMMVKGETLFDDRAWKEVERQREEWEAEECTAFDEDACRAEILENTAWNAYYNDMYEVEDISEAYYTIFEQYGDEMAEEFLKEMQEAGWYDDKE